MKNFLLGILTGVFGTRAAISIYEFFAHLDEEATFVNVIEASAIPMLWTAGAVISLAILFNQLFNNLKESNDAINRAKEELKRSGK